MVLQMSATPLRMQYCLDGPGYFQRFLFGVLNYDRTTALMDRDIFRRFCLVSSTTIGLIPNEGPSVEDNPATKYSHYDCKEVATQVCWWKKQNHRELDADQVSFIARPQRPPV